GLVATLCAFRLHRRALAAVDADEVVLEPAALGVEARVATVMASEGVRHSYRLGDGPHGLSWLGLRCLVAELLRRPIPVADDVIGWAEGSRRDRHFIQQRRPVS